MPPSGSGEWEHSKTVGIAMKERIEEILDDDNLLERFSEILMGEIMMDDESYVD